MDIPKGLCKHNCVGIGAICVVFGITQKVVVKYPRKADSEQFKHEVEFYQHKSTERACPDIVSCFLTLPNAIFLSNCTQGTLEQRIDSRQIREPTQNHIPGKLLEVTTKDSEGLICRWTQQLASAAAYLETLGVAHNDIHPRNLLLDERLNMKLSDFDSWAKIGDDFPGAPAPYARVLNDGPEEGTFGACGARTEQFAIGSILFIMLNGHEPYEDTDMEAEEYTDKFQALIFPELENRLLEQLVRRCWFAEFPTINNLKSQVMEFKSSELDVVEIDVEEERKFCEELVRSGLLESKSKPCPTESTSASEVKVCEEPAKSSLNENDAKAGNFWNVMASWGSAGVEVVRGITGKFTARR
ncbi:MAG: hypothetical protein Q9227_003889 [Pyrenula ochraceoflavens]